MSVAYTIAKRIHYAKADGTQRVSPPAVRIATLSIAIGLAVMLLTVAIVVGFKNEINHKIAQFGGDLQVLAVASNRTFEKQPICVSDSMLSVVRSAPGVSKAEPFITKPAVLKTDADFLCVVAHSTTDTAQSLVISETIARKLHLGVGDAAKLYFVQGTDTDPGLAYGSGASLNGKVRTLAVSDTYQTHFGEFDSQVVYVSLDLLAQVNAWEPDMVSGIEVHLQPSANADATYEALTSTVSLDYDRLGSRLMLQTARQQNPQIYAWLDLLDTNVWVILALMLAVSTFTMISGLLIIILERRQMIGVLKALGSSNGQLRRVFLYMASFLTVRGLLWGNVLGIALCLVQYFWHPVRLDPATYYLEWVPISLNGWHILALNVGTLIVTLMVLLVPSGLVARISPSRILNSE